MTSVTTSIVARGLSKPWGFLPDGSILVSEKPGTMRIVGHDGAVGGPLSGVPPVHHAGDAGLMDVALDPDFPQTRLVFFSFVEERGEGNGATVARGRLSDDGTALEGVVTIKEAAAYSNDAHYGCRLLFDPYRRLFVTFGERIADATRMRAQDLSSNYGKVLRIERDGSPARRNPFVGMAGADPDVWSFGHRNPQGLAFDRRSGCLWAVEHGPQAGDEVNRLEAGRNYGWPLVAYGTGYDGERVGKQDGWVPAMTEPVYYWDPAIAPSGAAFYFGDLVPEWRGDLFVAALAGEHLARLVVRGDRVVGEERLLQDQHQRIRHVAEGPDGALWVVTDCLDDGRLIRIRLSGRHLRSEGSAGAQASAW